MLMYTRKNDIYIYNNAYQLIAFQLNEILI